MSAVERVDFDLLATVLLGLREFVDKDTMDLVCRKLADTFDEAYVRFERARFLINCGIYPPN